MKQKNNSLKKERSLYLRSKKSNVKRQMIILFRQFEETLRSIKNRPSLRFLEETINNISQKKISLKKSRRKSKSPIQEFKRSQSCRNRIINRRRKDKYQSNNNSKKDEKILYRIDIKKLKRNGKYTYVKNDIDYKDKKKKDFIIIINKTKEMKKLIN